jgi:isopentenyl-diphosphate delta-isomerase
VRSAKFQLKVESEGQAKPGSITDRKVGHLRMALDPRSQTATSPFEWVKLKYAALPGINLAEISMETEFLGRKIAVPIMICGMTGGPKRARSVNENLAKAAQKLKTPMGVGSCRILLEKPEVLPTFRVRKWAPDVPILANLGAVQLNYGVSWKECQRIVDLTEADGLALHLNPLQEAMQRGGDTNFSDLVEKVGKVVEKLSVPVVVKEVGHGISGEVARKLYNVGVEWVDVAGAGGTSWAWIDGMLAGEEGRAERFKECGVDTVTAIRECVKVKGLKVIGSGGVRSGLDVAKCLALGAEIAGLARPFLLAALKSSGETEEFGRRLIEELRVAMFGVGCRNVRELRGKVIG